MNTLRIEKAEERFADAFLLVLGVYFLLQVIIRMSQPGALALDEAEQVYNAQRLLLGYDEQPPLYSWLQWLAFKVFGVGMLGLSALKNAMLFVLYWAMYQLAKPIIGTLGAAAASASLILFVPLGWESQVDRTHSVLVTTLAALTLWAYFAVLRRPEIHRRVLLGLLIGLGMQAKYNFAVFIAGLVVASLAAQEHRRVLWRREAWAIVLVAILVVLPHGLWFIDNIESATTDTLHKMGGAAQNAGNHAQNATRGLLQLASSIAAFIGLFAVTFAIVTRPWWRQLRIQSATADARFFLWLYASALGCVVALVLGGYLVNVKGRWLQPLLFSLPLAAFVILPASANVQVYRRLLLAAAATGVMLLGLLALRPALWPAIGKPLRMHQPYPELAAEVVRRFPQAEVVVAQDRHTAGNLRFHQSQFPTLLLEDLNGRQHIDAHTVLILVRAGTEEGWQQRVRETCPDAAVAEQGELWARPGRGGKEAMLFEYVLLSLQRR